jgi:hypothetical protein
VSEEHKFEADKFAENLRDRIHRDVHNRIDQQLNEHFPRRGRALGLLPGLVLIFLGTLVLLGHMGIISFDRVWRFWPLILIVAGVARFVECRNRLFAVLLMLFGGGLLLSNLGYVRLKWDDLWPLLLIGLGLSLIWSRLEMPKLPPASSGGGRNTINEFAVFGGVERRISATSFAGGTASAMFGGVELDFRSADIEGEEAVVLVEAVFGGIEFVVPERWMVIYEGQSIFGGYSDETRPPLPDVPGTPPRKRLVLRGRAVFGGISVKN